MATKYTFTDQDRDTCDAVMRAANAGTLTPNTVRVVETEGVGAGTTGLLDGRTRSTRSGMIRYAMVADHDGSIRWVSWFKVVA